MRVCVSERFDVGFAVVGAGDGREKSDVDVVVMLMWLSKRMGRIGDVGDMPVAVAVGVVGLVMVVVVVDRC